jgi:hypothetical protein
MPRPLVACGLLVAALAVPGCGGGGGGASPDQLVADSVAATKQVKSFHFNLDIENVPASTAGLQLTAAEGDALVPDRVEAQASGRFAGIPLTTELRAIGGTIWIKNPLSGDWQKVDVHTTPAFLLDPRQGVLGVMQAVTGLEKAGSEDVGGVATTRLRGRAAAADVAPLVAVSPGKGQVDMTLWIGDDDKVLRRIQVTGPVAEGEPADASRVVEISRLGEKVTVVPPEGAS